MGLVPAVEPGEKDAVRSAGLSFLHSAAVGTRRAGRGAALYWPIVFARAHPMKSASYRSLLFTNRWVRRIAFAVLATVACWLLAWVVVPPLLKHQLVKIASTELGRNLTVGDIDFKPWTLELTVRELAIATQDGATAQLAVRRLYIDAELESLLRLAPVVQALEIDAPSVRLRRTAEGRYDIDDMLARFAASSPQPADKTGREPVRFALFNLAVRDGTVELDDRVAGRTHMLGGLNLRLPFLSNLASRRDVTVTPELAFTLNGAAFASTASSMPFASSRKTDAQLRIQAMDLQAYLPYLPPGMPVRPRQAVLGADLQLQFEQTDRPQLVVRGQLQLSDVDVADAAGRDWLRLAGISVNLDELRPLEQSVRIGTVAIQSPRLTARRDASGRIDLGAGAGAPEPTPAAGAAGQGDASWTASLAHLQLRDGMLLWHDAATTPAAQLQLGALTLDIDDVVWPMQRAAAFKGALNVARADATGLAAASAPAAAPARLVFEGNATDRQAALKLVVSDLPLQLAAPYLAQVLEPGLHGLLHADLALHWQDAAMRLDVASLTLDRLALVQPGNAAAAGLPQVRQVAVSAAAVDLGKRLLTIDTLVLAQPELAVTRGADRRWMFERWLKSPAAGAPAAQPPSSGGAAPPPWVARLAHLQLRDAALRYEDAAQSKPVRLAVSGANLDLRNVALDGKQPIAVQLSARVAAGQTPAGKIDYRGLLRTEPLQTKGKLLVEQFPLHALEPYFGAGLNIEILRADAGFKGDVEFTATARGPQLRLQGDSVLEDFRANSLAAAAGDAAVPQELLNWKALGVRGVDLALAPGQPLRLAVRETTLSDFYARVIVHETGRINLQDLLRSDAPPRPDSGSTPAAATTPVAVTATAAGATAARPDASASDAPAPQIRIGPISLVQGKVFFSDRFVKPNYSANLSELTGRLSAFSSASEPGGDNMAELELRGRAEGTAALEILGKLNPLVDPLALDIKGTVRDLELPPLSPYAIKYAGHGIQRGKLSVDVAYQVLPNGQLTASNQVILNQLAFGDKVDGAPNSLPVKLAVALLADRNGVIDINLPISGSLNDPQFRLGPVIFKVIVNLIGKALTAPFTLLASAFGGGGDELSQVAFMPGSAQLQPDARSGLDKVAKALTDRPSLRMTVTGTANLEQEREAYKRTRLSALLQAEQRRAQVVAGQTPASSGDGQADPAPDPAQAQELLRQLVARSDIPKPRDLAGKAKELTTQDMEALLLANIVVDDEAMRELALRRGVAVRDYLASRQLPLERLFLGAAKLVDADAKWSPRAELNLGTN